MIISCWLEPRNISPHQRVDPMSSLQGNSISHLFSTSLSLSLPSHTHLAHSLLDSSINSARWRSVIISSTNKSRKFFDGKNRYLMREKKTFNEVQRSTRHAWTSNDTMTERFLWLFPASLEQPFVGVSREKKKAFSKTRCDICPKQIPSCVR